MNTDSRDKNLLILGIPISKISRQHLSNLLVKQLKSLNSDPLFIATVNPSFIVKAQKNKSFKKILTTKTNINTPDGVGIQIAADYLNLYGEKWVLRKFFGGILLGLSKTLGRGNFKILPFKITGVDLTKELLKICQKQNKSVLVVHRPDGLTSTTKVKNYLHDKYPRLNFDIKEVKTEDIKSTLIGHKCDVLLCALGEIKQEMFIDRNLSIIKPKVAIGIGGTFDVLVSNARPSSKINYDMYGLSWLLRLSQNPNRYKKILNSVILFPILVFTNSLRN